MTPIDMKLNVEYTKAEMMAEIQNRLAATNRNFALISNAKQVFNVLRVAGGMECRYDEAAMQNVWSWANPQDTYITGDTYQQIWNDVVSAMIKRAD